MNHLKPFNIMEKFEMMDKYWTPAYYRSVK